MKTAEEVAHEVWGEGTGFHLGAGEAVIEMMIAAIEADRDDHRDVRAICAAGVADTVPTRSEIADEISGIQVGTGYESTTIGISAALEAADAVLALLRGGSGV